MSNKIGKTLGGIALASFFLRMRDALQLRVSKVFMAIIFLSLATGCEPSVIKVKIVSKNGDTSFAIPAEMMPDCCRPKHEESNFASIDLDPKKLGGNGYYHIDLLSNGNNNSLIRKSFPDRVAAAEETASEFSGYKKYIQYKDPQMPFLLVGQGKSGNPVYLECANLHAKCNYYGIFDAKLAYEFMFPIAQLDNLENLIVYAQSQITTLMIKE